MLAVPRTIRSATAFRELFHGLRLAVQRLHLADHSSPVPKQSIRTQTEQNSGDTEDAG
jgi:hypothetical protein